VFPIIEDQGLAEDLISEVFLSVWRQAGQFEKGSSVSDWLAQIALSKLDELATTTRNEKLLAKIGSFRGRSGRVWWRDDRRGVIVCGKEEAEQDKKDPKSKFVRIWDRIAPTIAASKRAD
jgi:hypothetical protein